MPVSLGRLLHIINKHLTSQMFHVEFLRKIFSLEIWLVISLVLYAFRNAGTIITEKLKQRTSVHFQFYIILSTKKKPNNSGDS